MVQILNKLVHFKFPIFEIWCCHKHITQLPPSGLKFDTKLRKVFPNNLSPQLCTSHSRRKNIAPNFVCLFYPIKCKHVILRFLATFGTWYSFSNALFKAQMWQKGDEYIPKQVCQHRTAQVIITGKIRTVLHVNLILSVCSGQSNACIQNQDFGYMLAIVFLLINAFSKALIWHKAEKYVLKQFGSIALHKSLLETKKIF